jgi:trigger factor
MQTTPETKPATSSLERRVDISVALADLDKDVDQRLKRMGKTVKLAGFRPGKVPFSVVKQHYGAEARSEALNAALDRAFGETIRAQNLRIAGYPRIEPKQAQTETHIEFSAVFEVYPEFKIGDVSAESIEKAQLEVGAGEIDKTLDILRKQRVSYEDVERAAAKGDRVVVDFTGRKDGEVFQGGQANDYPFALGENQMLPDFEKAVEGLKAGETKTFDMTFPADYFAKDLAGQTVQFEIAVKKVQAAVLPEINEAFASSLGIADGDVTKMRTEIEGNLKREVKKRLTARIKEQAMEALLKTNPIDVPNALVEQEVDRLVEAARQDMASRGMKTKDLPIQPAWFADQAKRRVTLGLVLAELVKSENLHAKPEQVKAKIEESAQSYENPDEVVRWYYAQPERMADVEAVAMEDNVVEWVLSRAKVSEKAVSFDELMGAGAGAPSL